MTTEKIIRPPFFLKSILEIMFVILIIGVVGSVLTSIYLFFFEDSINFEIMDYEFSTLKPSSVFLMTANIGLKLCFAYLVYCFRNLIREFYHKELYSLSQIRLLRKIGIFIIGLSIGRSLLVFLAEFLLKGSAKVHVEIEFLDSFWFTIALGLFFVFLSKIFENARNLREENELTV